MVEGLPVLKYEHLEFEACALGKKHIDEFVFTKRKGKWIILELIHIDVCGPILTRSLGGALYFLIFVDDRSMYIRVYFIRKKSDVFEHFKEVRMA